MIFDELWRAERRAKKARGKLSEKYEPRLATAKKENNKEEYRRVLGELFFEKDRVEDGPNSLRTKLLVKRAKHLGISIPTRHDPWSAEAQNDESWEFNQTTGNFYLSDKAELELTRQIRKEEIEGLQHQMRWVSQVVIPITGLIGTIMGLLSLIHLLR